MNRCITTLHIWWLTSYLTDRFVSSKNKFLSGSKWNYVTTDDFPLQETPTLCFRVNDSYFSMDRHLRQRHGKRKGVMTHQWDLCWWEIGELMPPSVEPSHSLPCPAVSAQAEVQSLESTHSPSGLAGPVICLSDPHFPLWRCHCVLSLFIKIGLNGLFPLCCVLGDVKGHTRLWMNVFPVCCRLYNRFDNLQRKSISIKKERFFNIWSHGVRNEKIWGEGGGVIFPFATGLCRGLQFRPADLRYLLTTVWHSEINSSFHTFI